MCSTAFAQAFPYFYVPYEEDMPADPQQGQSFAGGEAERAAGLALQQEAKEGRSIECSCCI